MGDEELNFTEEEAQCWAQDPCNQERSCEVMVGVMIFCFLFLLTLVTVALINNSGAETSGDAETHAGALLLH
jgi:hypothetical protein